MEFNKKKMVMLAALLVIMGSCGGGMGTGGTATSEVTPVNTPSVVSERDENGYYRWNATDRSAATFKDNPNNKSSITAQTGAGVIVGVLDVGFVRNRADRKNPSIENNMSELLPSLTSSYVSGNDTAKDEDHGIYVADAIGGEGNGIAPSVTIYARDISGTPYIDTEDNDKSKANPVYRKVDYEWLKSKNVKIYNQSFGEDKGMDYYTESDYMDVFFPDIDLLDFYNSEVEAGKLFVWAAGNKPPYSGPTLEAGLPYFEPALEKGWLNVVGLTAQSESDLTAREFEWENIEVLSPAGKASNWTVAVLGDKRYSPTGGKFSGEGNYIIMTGSSFAAPVVTGTAALLLQKYPWMDGSLLRQTILSTATDVGTEGVDETFGWGILNIDKAVKGPSQFLKRLALADNVTVDVTTGVYIFSNDISGDAGIIKNGAGTLILSGDSSFTGGTTVNSGKLQVNGTYASGVSITPLGTFTTAEKAALSGSITNNGTYENSTETVVNGNYTATPSSRYVSNLGASMKVSGHVELNDSKLSLTSVKDGEAQYITAKGTETEIIKSDSGISGSFSEVKTSEMLEGSAESGEDKVTATLSRKNVEEYAAGLELSDSMTMGVAENMEATFQALDAEIEKGNLADVKGFASAAGQLQAMALSKDELDKLSGHIYGSAQALTFQHSQTINKDLSNRLVMLGTLDNVGDNAGLWITGIGARGKLKQDGFGSGDTDIFGGQVGVDKKFGNFILGGALSYSTSEAKFDRYGGKSTGDGFGLSVYGRYDLDIPVYLQGRLGMGFITSNVERDIMLTDVTSQRGKIEHKDKVFSGYVETGYDAQAGGFVITPYLGISHDTVSRGSFTEENSQFGLTAPKATFKQTSGHVGLRVGKSVEWSGGSKTTFQGYVSHQAAFNKEDLSFEAAYTGLSGAKFTVKGIGLSRHQTWGGLGVLTEVNPNFAWYINYDGKLSQKGNNNIFTTGFRVNF